MRVVHIFVHVIYLHIFQISVGALHIHYNVMFVNETRNGALNVTAYSGRTDVNLGIYPYQVLNRFQAERFCADRDYQRPLAYHLRWGRWELVRNSLKEHGVTQNISFYDGRFRPYFFEKTWFKDFTCNILRDSSEIMNMRNLHDQCAMVTFLNTNQDNSKIVIQETDCNTKLSVVCENVTTNEPFIDIYQNFEVSENDNNTVIEIVRTTTVAGFQECVQVCYNDTRCVSLSFNAHTYDCVMYTPVNGTTRNTNVSYEIMNTTESINHCVKSRRNLAEVFNDSVDNYNAGIPSTLPTCGVSPVPPGYCKCNETAANTTRAELEQIIADIVENLTISKDTTSKNRMKYISKYERRPYSVSAGVMAIVVIVVIMSLPVISDIGNAVIKATKKRKNRRKSRCIKVKPIEST